MTGRNKILYLETEKERKNKEEKLYEIYFQAALELELTNSSQSRRNFLNKNIERILKVYPHFEHWACGGFDLDSYQTQTHQINNGERK